MLSTSSYAQAYSWLCVKGAGITPIAVFRAPYVMLVIKLRSVTYKANYLPAVLSLQPQFSYLKKKKTSDF